MEGELKSILTGDIVNSRKNDPQVWQEGLKQMLKKYGSTPENWEIFRGDMFQLETCVEQSLEIAIHIKAQIKQTKNLDVRIAIGIGSQEFKTNKITESNGQAYINSGICFEHLKKRRLAIKTPWTKFDEEWNLHFRLASLTMDSWKPITALVYKTTLEFSSKNQEELAEYLKRSQSTISDSLKRAGYDEIKSMIDEFKNQVNKKLV